MLQSPSIVHSTKFSITHELQQRPASMHNIITHGIHNPFLGRFSKSLFSMGSGVLHLNSSVFSCQETLNTCMYMGTQAFSSCTNRPEVQSTSLDPGGNNSLLFLFSKNPYIQNRGSCNSDELEENVKPLNYFPYSTGIHF